MKHRCPYSGEVWFSTSFKEVKVPDILGNLGFPQPNKMPHPIFFHGRQELLKYAAPWSLGELSAQEAKLLFLSLLNSTSVVTFSHPAFPSESTVAANMESLFKIVLWYDGVVGNGDKSVSLPGIHITEHNQELANISVWMTAWFQEREEWLRPSMRMAIQNSLEVREELLFKYIHSPEKRTEQYSKHLARWAFLATKVHPDRREEWLAIFTAKGDDVFKVDLDELLDMIDWMESNLYAVDAPGQGYGSLQASKVLEHLRWMKGKREAGPLGELMGGQNFQMLDESGNFTESVELINTRIAALGAPEKEPRKEDYTGRLGAYIKDRAAWMLKKSLDPEAAIKDMGL